MYTLSYFLNISYKKTCRIKVILFKKREREREICVITSKSFKLFF